MTKARIKKALVVHDHDGRIRTVVTLPPDAPPIAFGQEPGDLVTEVELPEMRFDATRPEDQERIIEALQDYQVVREGKLVAKRKK